MTENRSGTETEAPAAKAPLKRRLLAGLAFILVPFGIHAVLSALVVETGGPPPSGCMVKVLLASAGPGEEVAFSIDAPFRIFEGAGMRGYAETGQAAWGYRLGDARARVDGEGWIRIDDRRLTRGDTLCIVPKRNGSVRVRQKSYPGVLLVEKGRDGGVRAVNMIEIEEYLACVLFREMPSSFPEEALKSQIVAARSYALYNMIHGKGYLLADERSQVFGGTDAMSARSRAIAAATAGEVLTFEGKLLPAYYSSTCGGMTVRADDVFAYPSPKPLNVNNACSFCSASPTYRWSAFFTYEEIADRFGLGSLCSRPEVGVTSIDSNRRAREIALLDRRGVVLKRLEASEFRRVLNRGRPVRNRLLSTRIDRIDAGETGITIEGGGFGHGVGLCQYGARGLALRGDDYGQILAFYYKDTEIARIADLDEAGRTQP